MAVLGYCLVCEKLVPIKAREFKHADSRERRWYPVDHDDLDGKPCPGVKRGI